MKGQISFAEFLVALLLFVSFSIYIYFQVTQFLPNYLLELKTQRLKSEAYQVSELLVNDLGNPINWGNGSVNSNQIKRIGLSDQNFNMTNYISMAKATRLQTECSNYQRVKGWIDIDRNFTILVLDKTTSSVIVSCQPPVSETPRINATVNRYFAFSSGDVGELIVQMW